MILLTGKWTPELVAKVSSLASQGIIKKINGFKLDKDSFSPEEAMAAVPLMALVESLVTL